MSKPEQAITAWSQLVIDSVAPLQAAVARPSVTMDDATRNDLNALFVANDRLVALLTSDAPHKQHDAMNIIGAIKGYAEMLLDESDGLHKALAKPLAAIVSATTTPANSIEPPDIGLKATTSATTVQSRTGKHCEPGVILAVDDMAENRELVSRQLGKLGHTVITAESGEEALELLDTQGVDVVLLDLMMPGIGGAEVLTHMKENEHLRSIPVIMISGRQDMDQIVACIQAGADDYLLKPFNLVLLQARIAAGIERKRWLDREERYRDQLERSERFIRATFGRYLSDDIVNDILERPEGLELGGDLREVTIMMSDIRGFTTLSEHLPPQRVVQLLNRYLGRMTDIILDYRGTIDEFLGDAVLAVFGAPRSDKDDTERAVQCAIAMQRAMDEINTQNMADELPELRMAIALNTGTVVAGNIGSERRAKYGFVGHAMNVTSRIEDKAEPGSILISESTLEKLSGSYRVGDRQEISAKGLEENVVVYTIGEQH